MQSLSMKFYGAVPDDAEVVDAILALRDGVEAQIVAAGAMINRAAVEFGEKELTEDGKYP